MKINNAFLSYIEKALINFLEKNDVQKHEGFQIRLHIKFNRIINFNSQKLSIEGKNNTFSSICKGE